MPLRGKLRQNRAQQHRTDASESDSKVEQRLQQTIAKGYGRTVVCVRHPEGGSSGAAARHSPYPLYALRRQITTRQLSEEKVLPDRSLKGLRLV